ncbi:Haloalkane dehalogenase [Pseudovibrio sp. Ad13]|uniref:haloalkane dehalogenase n=1 Tax=Pseudovibrio sp. Ad13 TaxID=989396 RepID=UPI0007AE6D67|nr:haloalkane dehalogenase [Pseudovibrio sp. Ad13]KZK83088.1 Haloalkane dehalogenase [Pseudovibrio sp. Ad13]
MCDESNSADFHFTSRRVDVLGNSIHYIEEGAGDPVLFIHGNPTSSYIWRNIIPHVSPYARAIAVDLIGFGKSAKPDIAYGFDDSYAHIEGFIEALGLTNVTLVVQDWGSGLGFHYANLHRERIKGIVFMEAMHREIDFDAMAKGEKALMRMIRSRFTSWLLFGVMNSFVKRMLPDWVKRDLSKKKMAAYLAPFPTVKSRKPIYVFPRDVPVQGKPVHISNAVANYSKWLTETPIPKLFFHADPGVLIRKTDVAWIEQNFPNLTSVDLGKGLHFLQED